MRWLTATILSAFAFTAAPLASRADGVAPNLIKAQQTLAIVLPDDIATLPNIARPLDQIGRERCDRNAIIELGKALEAAGYRRESANASIRFSALCGGHEAALQAAVNVLLQLSDFETAKTTATTLLSLNPSRYLTIIQRALAHEKLGEADAATADYSLALTLATDRSQIPAWAFLRLAELYAKAQRPCDAAATLHLALAANPVRNDDAITRTLLTGYQRNGACSTVTAAREEVFPTSAGGLRLHVPVVVNGVTGNFIIDTGATLVAITESFAAKAQIVRTNATVPLRTANGTATAHLGIARNMELRSLAARNVQLVAQSDQALAPGGGVDGLLGMSFLSRFTTRLDAREIRITAPN